MRLVVRPAANEQALAHSSTLQGWTHGLFGPKPRPARTLTGGIVGGCPCESAPAALAVITAGAGTRIALFLGFAFAVPTGPRDPDPSAHGGTLEAGSGGTVNGELRGDPVGPMADLAGRMPPAPT
jgi:hypothetical protein